LSFAASSPEGSSASILASIACRRRSDLRSLPLLPDRCRPFGGGWDFRPDHHWNMRRIPSRAKRNLRLPACG
jgi:hypothetical protein